MEKGGKLVASQLEKDVCEKKKLNPGSQNGTAAPDRSEKINRAKKEGRPDWVKTPTKEKK